MTNLINLLLEMPEGTTEASLPEGAADTLATLFRIRPGAMMPGTRAVLGKMLHYTVIRDGPLDETDLQGMLDQYSLPWVIMGMQSVLSEIPATYDAEGSELTPAEPQVFVPLNAAGIAPYINPDIDENGVETPRTGYIQLSQFDIRNRVEWGITVPAT